MTKHTFWTASFQCLAKSLEASHPLKTSGTKLSKKWPQASKI